MTWAVGMSGWMWVLMALATIGFWVVVVLAVRELFAPGPAQEPSVPEEPSPPEESLRLLDERFARGEIDPEEYLQGKWLLTRGR